MLLKWWRQSPKVANIDVIYGAIVAQARVPGFYANYSVPDTVEGRFDMIVLHLFLFLRRIEGQTVAMSGLGQALFDRFCSDLDANLREMGVGDLTVPRKMQKFAEAYFGRSAAYERALAANDHNAGGLALARNIFAQDFATPSARRLSQYMFAAAAMLAASSDDAIGHGKFAFPNPVDVGAAQELSADGQ
jgi:cytochrome b pre-mRNA-processing protein 3